MDLSAAVGRLLVLKETIFKISFIAIECMNYGLYPTCSAKNNI